MISFDQARDRILAAAPSPRRERVQLLGALNRVLAEDVAAPRDAPPWDNTAVDGFAVRAADTAGAAPERPASLTVIETVPAGRMPSRTVGPGQATRIMTGAPMPAGADAVVMVEDTATGGDQVDIQAAVAPAENVRPRGEDVRAGTVMLTAGTPLRPAELAMLASFGRSQVRVTRRPRVGILSTGDELAEIDEPVTEEKILNVNSWAVAAQVLDAGAVPVLLGIARDKPDEIREAIGEGLSTDVLIISGGVSMGDYDFVKDVLSELGGGLAFWKVRIKPARPLAFGTLGSVPAFGLPGNPVSSMVSFEVFVRPFLRKAMGHAELERPVVKARLTEPVRKKAGRRFFLRAVVHPDGHGGHTARTTGSQGSGVLSSMVLANALMDLPEDLDGPLPKGETVSVRLL
jgi:molybdopterin molybdotransferase